MPGYAERHAAKVWSTPGVEMKRGQANPVDLEIFRNLFVSIADEMGAVLRKTAFSANIKERRDYSCAVYGKAGETINEVRAAVRRVTAVMPGLWECHGHFMGTMTLDLDRQQSCS